MFFQILTPIFALQLCTAQVYHHSSTGDYHVEWKEFGACPPEKRGTNEFFTDQRLSRKRRKTEIVGNLTLLVPFDDSFSVNVNFAILGSNAGWLPNAYNIPLSRACTSLVSFLQDGWTDYLKSMNIATKCPIPKGVYEQKGFDMNNFLRGSVLPKHFIYGRYKVTVEYIRKKAVAGCTYFVMAVVPAWQKKKEKN